MGQLPPHIYQTLIENGVDRACADDIDQGRDVLLNAEALVGWLRFAEHRGALRERRRIYGRLDELKPAAKRFDQLRARAVEFSNVVADALWWFKGWCAAKDSGDAPDTEALRRLKACLDELADPRPPAPLPF